MLSKPRISINAKLYIIYGALMLALIGTTAISFLSLNRVGGTADRVAQRYAPQLDLISDAQMLMFRISLEARHAMLAQPGAERDASFARIGQFRKEMLDKLETFSGNVTTQTGREMLARIREADKDFWRLGGEVVAKIQANDIPAAFAQLNADLVPARDRMVKHIADQRQWQQQLVIDAVTHAREDALQAKLTVVAVALVASVLAAWMAWSLITMMRGAFNRAQAVTQRIAGGNLGSEIYIRPGDEFGSLFGSIADMQQRLLAVVAGVRAVAHDIVTAAQAIDEANRALSEASQLHAQSVHETSTSAHRMMASVRDSTSSVETVNRLASEAASIATSGGTVVSEVVTTMRGIDAASKRIADIVSVIDGIAFQTNILALNASVEAARAGEHGRGFAVVAEEVRNLAQRAASAAREIKGLINDSVQRVDTGASLAEQAGQTMQRIVGSVAEVTALMAHVSQSARAQGSDVDAVVNAVDHIGVATGQSVAAVERSNSVSAALRDHAQALEAAVAAFNLETA